MYKKSLNFEHYLYIHKHKKKKGKAILNEL